MWVTSLGAGMCVGTFAALAAGVPADKAMPLLLSGILLVVVGDFTRNWPRRRP